MSDDAIRIGVVGLGRIAQWMHLPVLDELEDFELAAVCDHSRLLVDAVGTRYGIPPARRYADAEALVASPLDAVAVLTPNHAEVVLGALAAKRSVFVEKPLCWTPEEADAIVDAQSAAEAVVAVGYMKRHDVAVRRAARELADLGSAFYARFHNFAGGRHRFDRMPPLVKPTDLSRAHLEGERARVRAALAEAVQSDDPARVELAYALLELASHDVNLLRALLGPVEHVADATASPVEGTPFVTAQFLHAGGARTQLELAPFFDDARDWDEELVIWARAGRVAVRFANPFVRNLPTQVAVDRLDDLTVERRELVATFESPFRRQLAHFAQCVRDRRVPDAGVLDAREDVRLLVDVACSAVLVPALPAHRRERLTSLIAQPA